MAGERELGWCAWETVGLGSPNPRSRAVIHITPEMGEQLEREALTRGLTVEEYLATFDEPEKP